MAEKNPHPDDEDDGEYELEPVDPEILAHERQRGELKTSQAKSAVDIDEVYRETEASDPITWDDLRGFRFTIRHLLIATAVLAIVLTLWELARWLGLFIAGIAALAAGWFFVLRKERRDRLLLQRRLEELEQSDGDELPTAIDDESVVSVEPAWRFSFSLKEMFAALTAAAVVFGLVHVLGGPENAALFLGMIALAGLVLQLFGFEAPPVVILGWWLLLVLYIVVSLWAAFGSGNQAALPGP